MPTTSARGAIESEDSGRVRTAVEILATAWGMRLTSEELEWLSVALKERAEHKRREAGSEVSAPAGHREASEASRPGRMSR